MNEEEKIAQATQPRVRKSAQKSHPAPILAYLVALFAVAFALLLLSYFRQQRASDQELISGLRENASAMQTVSTVLDRNKLLEEENAQLKDRVEELEDAEARAEASDRTARALDWLWRIEREFFRKRYSAAREMAVAFEESGLVDALPDAALTDPEYRSPAEQYQSIYEALF